MGLTGNQQTGTDEAHLEELNGGAAPHPNRIASALQALQHAQKGTQHAITHRKQRTIRINDQTMKRGRDAARNAKSNKTTRPWITNDEAKERARKARG